VPGLHRDYNRVVPRRHAYADGNSYPYRNRYTDWYAFNYAKAKANTARSTNAQASSHPGA
jgi:hypothetical protein